MLIQRTRDLRLPDGVWTEQVLNLQQRTAYNDYYNCILRDAKVCSAPPTLNRVTASENGDDRGQPRRRVSYTALKMMVSKNRPPFQTMLSIKAMLFLLHRIWL